MEARAGGPAGVLAEAPRKVAVLRALQLGDMLCAVPALRALRAGLPEAEMTLLGLPWARELPERFPRYIDRWLHFPGFPGFPEQRFDAAAFRDFLDACLAEGFDLAVQLHGDGTLSNPAVEMLGAKRMAGSYRAGAYCPDPETFAVYEDDVHEVRCCLHVVERLGFPADGEHLELPLYERDFEELRRLPEWAALSGTPYAVVHPGARFENRRWPPELFARVADELAGEGLGVVLTGVRADAPLTAAVRQTMRSSAIDLAGRTSLGALGALVSGAKLVVCNDTGVSHVAAAMRTPSVVVVRYAAPERWAPLDASLHRVLDVRDGRDGVGEALRLVREQLSAGFVAHAGGASTAD